MSEAKFKNGDIFFHPEQKVIVEVADAVVPHTKYKKPNTSKDWLYDLYVLNPDTNIKKPWKRYWEEKVMEVLVKLENLKSVETLYKSNK